MLSVVFRPQAQADALDARTWYANHSASAAELFVAELTATVDRVADHPTAFPTVHNSIRRAVLHRFPYAVYFVLQEEAIVVLAVHGRQDPERWKSRA